MNAALNNVYNKFIQCNSAQSHRTESESQTLSSKTHSIDKTKLSVLHSEAAIRHIHVKL